MIDKDVEDGDQSFKLSVKNKKLRREVRKLRMQLDSPKYEEIIVSQEVCLDFIRSLSRLIGRNNDSVPVPLFCQVMNVINEWAMVNGKKIFVQESTDGK